MIVEENPRTSLAILFFALAILVLFFDYGAKSQNRILFLIFLTSCIISHYSTSYIFFVILMVFGIQSIVLRKYIVLDKLISSTTLIIFFCMIFVWYGQIIGGPFESSLLFIDSTIIGLNNFFLEESRSLGVSSLMGSGSSRKGGPF
ncbi:MAG: DUF2206 domain-containing protein, partial [Minisyncoccia bacterium]